MTCKEIKEFLDKESGFDISDKCRERIYVIFRSWFYYFCYKYAIDCYSLKYVGELLNRDHSTVLHNYRKFVDYYPFDVESRNKTVIMESKLCEHFGIELINHTQETKKNTIEDVRRTKVESNIIESLKDRVSFLESKLKRREALIISQSERITYFKNQSKSKKNLANYYKKKAKI